MLRSLVGSEMCIRDRSHLATQLARGCVQFVDGNPAPGCPNGMVVFTGREQDGGGVTGQCDYQVWEMAPPNHATLGIHLGLDVDQMLAVFEPSATSWSQRINNQWDTAGIKDTAGYGTVTSHYGMHIVAWHIPLALTGQTANLQRGSLMFDPKMSMPFSLPVLLPGVLGTLAVRQPGEFSVKLTVGELQLSTLVVSGCVALGAPFYLRAGSPAVLFNCSNPS
eukprot:TRINITY_DN14648_c0_g1_i1.p1 TRINITY_DN14648_c0_g1~~TRINITY_DN14648_c0_g1_i1.p1  ORF type:complete len:256 (+),score=58.98 TRINITY_DN14648_c0_g1_i1:105-770(+)